jgi:hypothetical protein
VQSQSRDEEEKYEHDAELDEKEQNQLSEFFLIDFEEVRRPGDTGVPKQSGRGGIEQGEDEADDKYGKEKIPEENDFVAFHVAIIHLNDAGSRPDRSFACCVAATDPAFGGSKVRAAPVRPSPHPVA